MSTSGRKCAGFLDLLKDLFRDRAVIKATACMALVSEQMCPGIGDHLGKPRPPGRTSCPPKTGA